MNKKIIPLIALSSLLLCTAAEAGVVRTVENGNNVIYVTGLTSGSSATLQQTGALTSSARLANACGVVRLTKPAAGWSGNITVNGTSVNPTTLPVLATVPTCVGTTLTPAQTANFRDGSDNIYLVGLTPSSAATIGLPSNSTRSARANGCGFARFAQSTTSPWTSTSAMTINGTATTFDAITSQTYPPYCRNVGTGASPNYVRYEAVTTP